MHVAGYRDGLPHKTTAAALQSLWKEANEEWAKEECSRTVKTRCSEMHTARSVISGGEPLALLESEVLTLNDEEKKQG